MASEEGEGAVECILQALPSPGLRWRGSRCGGRKGLLLGGKGWIISYLDLSAGDASSEIATGPPAKHQSVGHFVPYDRVKAPRTCKICAASMPESFWYDARSRLAVLLEVVRFTC